jgi:hypothetical protein
MSVLEVRAFLSLFSGTTTTPSAHLKDRTSWTTWTAYKIWACNRPTDGALCIVLDKPDAIGPHGSEAALIVAACAGTTQAKTNATADHFMTDAP